MDERTEAALNSPFAFVSAINPASRELASAGGEGSRGAQAALLLLLNIARLKAADEVPLPIALPEGKRAKPMLRLRPEVEEKHCPPALLPRPLLRIACQPSLKSSTGISVRAAWQWSASKRPRD